MNELIIDSEDMFTRYKQNPLKVTGYSKVFELQTLRENDDAFLDNKQLKMIDVPLRLQGLPMLKGPRFQPENIQMEATSPATIYVAINAEKSNPLPVEFEYTGLMMSVGKIENQAIENMRPGDNHARLSSSVPYRIYQRNFNKEVIGIELYTVDRNRRDVELLMFYTVNAEVA